MRFGTASSTSSRSCAAGAFADFTDLAFDELQAVVDALPLDPADYPDLRVGDQGIKRKRWYVEGYERFDDQASWCAATPRASRCAPGSTTRSRRPSPRWAPTSTSWPPSWGGAGSRRAPSASTRCAPNT